MRKFALAVLVIALVPALTACRIRPASPPVEIVVSAAASLADVMKEIGPKFEAENKSVKLRFNFGSSGALQQQIEKGAPVDLFISAAKGPMDALENKGLVETSAAKTLASNQVVLIRGKSTEGAIRTWDDLKDSRVKKIAVGNPQHVPAGQYGQTVLQRLNLRDAVAGKLVFGEDVRQVLNYVESGEVQAGIVYRTDAASSKKVVVVAEAPAGSHEPVVYPMAVIKGAGSAAQAKAFADYLLSARGREVLSKYGFGAAD